MTWKIMGKNILFMQQSYIFFCEKTIYSRFNKLKTHQIYGLR